MVCPRFLPKLLIRMDLSNSLHAFEYLTGVLNQTSYASWFEWLRSAFSAGRTATTVGKDKLQHSPRMHDESMPQRFKSPRQSWVELMGRVLCPQVALYPQVMAFWLRCPGCLDHSSPAPSSHGWLTVKTPFACPYTWHSAQWFQFHSEKPVPRRDILNSPV